MNTKQEFTITVYTENDIGLINRITIIFLRKKINIASISAGPTEVEDIQRFTIVITETEENVQKVTRQIEKQVGILKAYYHTEKDLVWQEMAMYKMPTNSITTEVKVGQLIQHYKATIVTIRNDYTVFEITGKQEEITGLKRALEPFGLEEFIRSPRIAMVKDSPGIGKINKE